MAALLNLALLVSVVTLMQVTEGLSGKSHAGKCFN